MLPPLRRFAVMAGHWPDTRLPDGRPLAGHAVLSGRTCGRPLAGQERRKPPVLRGVLHCLCCASSIRGCWSALRATPHIAVCGCAAVGRRAARARLWRAFRVGFGSAHKQRCFRPDDAARRATFCLAQEGQLVRWPGSIVVMAGHWPDTLCYRAGHVAGHGPAKNGGKRLPRRRSAAAFVVGAASADAVRR